MRLAQIQMHVTADKTANLRHAEELLRSVRGADMAILPEMFCCPYDNSCFGAYGEPEGGEAQTALSHLAAELGLYLVGGTVPELSEGRIYNTCLISTSRGDSGSGSRTPSPREMPSPPSRRPSAPWGCASASTCGSRSWPGACACGGQR